MFVLVAHFRTDQPLDGPVPEGAGEPLALLSAAPECRRLTFAQSTESAGVFVLVAEFDSAASYRRALSPWPMRTVVVPWLSSADQATSQVSEVLLSAVDGVVTMCDRTVPDPGS